MSRPLVAIVGRPNVGKSTLFNRLIHRRAAIVQDVPGVTRDRHYADADLLGREVTVVDTGGFVPDSREDPLAHDVSLSLQWRSATSSSWCATGAPGSTPVTRRWRGS